MRRNIVAIAFLCSITSIVHPMEKESTDILKEGPFQYLDFIQEKIDKKNGIAHGWIRVLEYPNEYVYVRVKFDDNGYSLHFVDKNDIETAPGLFLWRTTGLVTPSPISKTGYYPEHEQGYIFWNDKSGRTWESYLYSNKPFTNLFSLQDVFKSNFAMYNKHLPASIRTFREDILQNSLFRPFEQSNEYRYLNQEQKNTILSYLTPQELLFFRTTLHNKLKNSAIDNLDNVIEQYIIESIQKNIRHNHELDMYRLLKQIEQLRVCPLEERIKFNKKPKNVVDTMAATGIIECSDLLQSD